GEASPGIRPDRCSCSRKWCCGRPTQTRDSSGTRRWHVNWRSIRAGRRPERASMEMDEISVLGGFARTGEREPVERLEMRMGDVVSIVGPTGSGKTALINDVALFADANTPSRRRVLVNGEPPPPIFQEDPSHNPIALI